MPEATIVRLFDLLEKANEMDINLSLENDGLAVRFPKGKRIDQGFLNELRSSKDRLIDHLRNYQSGGLHVAKGTRISGRTDIDGKAYYEVSPIHSYWIDDKNLEFKEKMYGLFNFKILGEVDIDAFRRAVFLLIKRHESLRTTFQYADGKYLMCAEDESAPMFDIGFRDLRAASAARNADIRSFSRFYDHRFDVWKGPLFLVRLTRTGDLEYILSIKIHHSIYDGWSMEILQRDLFTAYTAYTKKEQPDLPELKLQYKDYMFFMRRSIREQEEENKKYWRSIYDSLPPEPMIPGAKKTNSTSSCRNGKAETFVLPPDAVQKLNKLSVKYGGGLFVVLQATVKLYFSRLTGQGDIVIGTLVAGREDFPGFEDQIGNYSKMNFIRTVLDKEDTLEDVILKVKKSNEDMRKYWSYSLISYMESMYPPGQPDPGCFRKINLQYNDTRGFYVNESVFEGLSSPGIDGMYPLGEDEYPVAGDNGRPSVTDLDLKWEFIDLKDRMDLFVHYDCDRYDEETLRGLVDGYMSFLGEIL